MNPDDVATDRVTGVLWSENARLNWQVAEAAGSRVHRCLRLIREHYADERLNLDAAARCCHVSPSQLNRILARSCGTSFKRILTWYRLWEAWRLLNKTPLSIQEIADQTGFGDGRNMQRAFRRYLGIPPTEGRQMRINVAHMLISGLPEAEKEAVGLDASTRGGALADEDATASHGGEE